MGTTTLENNSALHSNTEFVLDLHSTSRCLPRTKSRICAPDHEQEYTTAVSAGHSQKKSVNNP